LLGCGRSCWAAGGDARRRRPAPRAQALYPPPPYYQGRWSNGRVYTEYIAQLLGLRLADNAVGGASSGAHNNSILSLPGNFPAAARCLPPGTPPQCPAQARPGHAHPRAVANGRGL
jgi:hypothetical protein